MMVYISRMKQKRVVSPFISFCAFISTTQHCLVSKAMKKGFQETIFIRAKNVWEDFRLRSGTALSPRPLKTDGGLGGGGVPQGPTYAGWRTPSAPIDVPILLTFFYLSKYLTISSSVCLQTQKSIKKTQRTGKEMKQN